MSIRRGCSVHGKNVGLHGDKTTSGAQCIAARPGMSVMGLLKLYIGDKTTPCPKCGEVGVIVEGDHRCSNSAAVAVDGAEIRCGCPQGSNLLIAPDTITENQPLAASRMQAVDHKAASDPHTQPLTKPQPEKILGIDAGFVVLPYGGTTETWQRLLFTGTPPAGAEALFSALNVSGREHKAGSIMLMVDPDRQDNTQIAHMKAAKARIDAALTPLTAQQARFLHEHRDTVAMFAAASSIASDTADYAGQVTEAAKGYFERIEKILSQIQDAYKNQYLTRGTLMGEQFFVERHRLLGQLDSVLKMFMKKRFMFTEYTDLKSALGISAKSIMHRWNETGVGDIEGYATHIEKMAKYVKLMETAGKVGVWLSAFDTAAKITEACTTGRDCEKTAFTSVGEFSGSLLGGAVAGKIAGSAAANTVCAVVLGAATIEAAGAGALLCTLGVNGAIAYGSDKAFSWGGEFVGDKIYEITNDD